MIRGYHFVGNTLRDGSSIPENGEWLEFGFPIKICAKGYHASRHVSDALKYAPDNTLCLVDLDGEIEEQDDKLCASKRRIVARFDATELLQKDARDSALSVIHLWQPPEIVLQFLRTGDLLLAGAASCGCFAARDAANAACNAASDAANAANAANAAYAACCAAYAADTAYAACNAASDAAYAADAANAACNAAYAANAVRDTANRIRLQAAVDAKFAELLK